LPSASLCCAGVAVLAGGAGIDDDDGVGTGEDDRFALEVDDAGGNGGEFAPEVEAAAAASTLL
jgi:hypothetical protein